MFLFKDKKRSFEIMLSFEIKVFKFSVMNGNTLNMFVPFA